MCGNEEFLTISEAREWATSYLKRKITSSNIEYLIQYGKIFRYDENEVRKRNSSGITKVSLTELKNYYDTAILEKERKWKEQLGNDISWELAFSDVQETTRTKHVHRLHPYKGKFIPQLVEYFLDEHTNELKKKVFFHKGDTILDPFVGSGTTLVQCKELGLNSIGIDISKFNCMITQVKVQKYDLETLRKIVLDAAKSTEKFSKTIFDENQENCIRNILSNFNARFYPNPEYKRLIKSLRKIEHDFHSSRAKISQSIEIASDSINGEKKIQEDFIEKFNQKIKSFFVNNNLQLSFNIDFNNEKKFVNSFTTSYAKLVLDELNDKIDDCKTIQQELLSDIDSTDIIEVIENNELGFLKKWFTDKQLKEMKQYISHIDHVEDAKIQNVMKVILSRAIRSSRATKHSDLATLVKPQTTPYYCTKHYKICKPIQTIIPHLKRYTRDTISRLKKFDSLQTDVHCVVINGDSTKVDIFDQVRRDDEEFYNLLKERRIDGIFTSPPYLGLIDYHEQHAYAYELLDIERKDVDEIGRMSNGTGLKAKEDYIEKISRVLVNVKKYLAEKAPIFIVANDSHNLYPEIAKRSNLKIIAEYKRPVLNRTERDKQPYSESIFHMQ